MDQREDQIQKRFNKKQFLKRTLQFVFSVSVFSIFFWYSSGFSIHPQSFNVYFSTCLFSMITHTLERKYMFLICNGILAFIAKTSSLMSPSAPSMSDSEQFQFQASNDLSETRAPVSDMAVVPLRSFESPENVPVMVEEQVKLQEEYHEEVSEAEEQEECTLQAKNEACIAEEEEEFKGIDEEGEGGGTESGDEVEPDNEPAETTMTSTSYEELANTDELNRKFEEFIRKMKEEMRIEAQRPLIAV